MTVNNYEHDIYLAGQISDKCQESYTWRKNIEDYYFEKQNINIINPCNCQNNIDRCQKSENNQYDQKGINLIVGKDRNFVNTCDVIIANFNIYNTDQYIIGTFFELAWSFDDPTKTIIGICKKDIIDHPICKHPFIQTCVRHWCKNEVEVCDIIDLYFSV